MPVVPFQRKPPWLGRDEADSVVGFLYGIRQPSFKHLRHRLRQHLPNNGAHPVLEFVATVHVNVNSFGLGNNLSRAKGAGQFPPYQEHFARPVERPQTTAVTSMWPDKIRAHSAAV